MGGSAAPCPHPQSRPQALRLLPPCGGPRNAHLPQGRHLCQSYLSSDTRDGARFVRRISFLTERNSLV